MAVKPSKRNQQNATAKAERYGGKAPALSKYARKRVQQFGKSEQQEATHD